MKKYISFIIIFFFSVIAFAQSDNVDKNTISKTDPAVEVTATAIPFDQISGGGIVSADYHKAVNLGDTTGLSGPAVEITAVAVKDYPGLHTVTVKKEIQKVGNSGLQENSDVIKKTVEIRAAATRR